MAKIRIKTKYYPQLIDLDGAVIFYNFLMKHIE